MKETRIVLWDWPRYVKETIYCVWQNSRVKGFNKTPQEVNEDLMINDPRGPDRQALDLQAEVDTVFRDVVTQKLPLGEMIDFVFMVHNCPIPLREQMVRHRIGHKFGENYAVDVIPEIASSTWWSQTGRVKDMGTFADDEDYHIPKSIREHKIETFRELWREKMSELQDFYNWLRERGIPNEDAREVLPYGTQMDIAWKLNFTALVHVLSKRTCWIAQLGVWEPVIHGMISELTSKVDPVFRDVAQPPCFDNKGEWIGCAFPVENKNRLPGGIDPYPPCSLWLNKQWVKESGHEDASQTIRTLNGVGMTRTADYMNREEQYAALWGRNPRTGEKVRLA